MRRGIDHLVGAVPELEAAAKDYAALDPATTHGARLAIV